MTKNTMRRTTIMDVAKAAKVSKTVAATVLNGGAGNGRASEITRARILEAATKLGYHPHAGAQSMRRSKFGMIGVIMLEGQLFPDIPTSVISGAADVLSKNNLKLVILRVPPDFLDKEKITPGLFAEYMVDGFLIGGWRSMRPNERKLIENNKYPIVWMNFKSENNSVHHDDISAGRLATESLIKMGHKRISFVNFSGSAGHHSTRDRLTGYFQAMEKAGLKACEFAPVKDNIPRNIRMTKSKEILSAENRPTGIVAYQQSSSLPVLFGATSMMNLQIPKDLSLVTFGETVEDAPGIEISTVLHPDCELGTKAANMLLRRIASNGEAEKSVKMPVTEIKGSTITIPPDLN